MMIYSEPANPIDAHIGSRLRLRRALMKLSQEQLGRQVGLTCQQIQKYEKGANRIGAGRLYVFSRILDVPPSYFFDGLDQASDGENGAGCSEPLPPRETLDLVQAYHRIPDPQVRQKILDLLRSLSEAGPYSPDEPW